MSVLCTSQCKDSCGGDCSKQCENTCDNTSGTTPTPETKEVTFGDGSWTADIRDRGSDYDDNRYWLRTMEWYYSDSEGYKGTTTRYVDKYFSDSYSASNYADGLEDQWSSETIIVKRNT